MRPQDRAVARQHLDKRMKPFKKAESLARPPRGWVRAVREALGMTAAQLGDRLGVSAQRALAIEKGELSGAITLNSLEHAARALDCRLVYTLLPRKPLEALVRERARLLAERRLKSTGHTMALENQRAEKADEAKQLERLTRQLLEKSGSVLWNEK
jgi:predicted DNA-binding mobile mystery protein A